MFAGKKSAQIREILISESAWEEMTCLFAPSLGQVWANAYDTTQDRQTRSLLTVFFYAIRFHRQRVTYSFVTSIASFATSCSPAASL
ncbi:hypothetical protein EXY15_03400 [Klebsiella pneumoniae]|nr:hypothetical protein [Klebsiella pneumoniae]